VKPEDLTIPLLEKAVGRKAKSWPGNCYALASKARELLGFGTLAYGHYLGPVSTKGFWKAFAKVPFVQHGWVILPGKLVLDPTRWSFLNEKPSIWIGPDDEYDRGGQVWRSTRSCPPPADDAAKNKIVLEISAEAAAHINSMLLRERAHGQINYAQAVWLASGPVEALGSFAHQFFELLIENDWRAAIPIDTRRMVMGEDG
jgi:hypothetical protein